MAEINQYMLSHTELTEIILRHLNVHEGRWLISLNIQTGIGHFALGPDQPPYPGAAFTIAQVGINRVLEGAPLPPNALVVEAEKVNPRAKSKAKRPGK